MLSLLHIENIAVVEKADIEFEKGLNVLTGETGAGKSIVIDSLEAALGWRTSRELVRRGAKSALVTAVFTGADVKDWCEDNGAEYDDELVLTRKIGEDGKSSCRINGMPISAVQMRELGLRLIDIHGQGDGQRLTDERYHRSYLDGFGGTDKELQEYRQAYNEYKSVQDELDALSLDESEKERRIDILTFQIAEIERAGLVPGEYEEKHKRREFLKSAGKLTGAVRDAAAALYGGERSDGAISLIGAAAESVSYALRFSDELSGISEKLNDLRYAAEDVAEELRDIRERLDFSPEELDELDERLDTLRRVLKKYGGSEEAALEFLDDCKRELENIEYADERRRTLEAKLSRLRAAAEGLAGKLSDKRRSAAEELEKRIEKELSELSMGGASFKVEVSKAPLGPYGADDVRFLMAANAGEAMGRISKVASGGELSRIMLAMKTVLASRDDVQSMVFDEIDTGVSGIAAQRVAEKLAVIGRGKQVICVTHLPQIAAMADTHFSIEKREDAGRTFTSVTKLDIEGRKSELARLTGGANITETTLRSAQEQLDAAKNFKQTLGHGA
ncbi:MAG: DNA repair protein RecN [Oscillospiraceae bacterium]